MASSHVLLALILFFQLIFLSAVRVPPFASENLVGSFNVTIPPEAKGKGDVPSKVSSTSTLDLELVNSVLPGDDGVLLTDVTATHLFGVISDALGYEYLSSNLNETERWPLRGIVYGQHRRLMLSASVTLSPKKAKANDVKARLVAVHFLLDTRSPKTYLSEEAVKALAEGRYYYDIYGTVPVIINGVSINAKISPPQEYFHDICLIGADFLEAIEAELVVLYGGAESFTLSKGY